MAQTGYTPIQLYYSTTASAVPTNTNLANGELAINITDGKLYYKDNTGTVKLLAGATSGPAGGSNTQVQYNSSGVLAGSSNMTFDGTSLTLGGNPTLSAGTANGVTYLNGSKVLTSGSALTFDGSTLYNSGNISVGGNSGGNRYVALLNETNTYTGTLMLQAGGGSATYGGAVVMYGHSHASYPGAVYVGSSSGTSTGIIFGNGGIAGPATSEWMRLTSTGLGIGTSSPSSKLEVASDDATTALRVTTASNQNYQLRLGFRTASLTGEIQAIHVGTAYRDIVLQRDGGNLGLGVTPSAWASPYKALEIYSGGNSVVSFGASDIALTSGGYYNGGWKYGATNSLGANAFELYNGTFIWYQKTAVAHTAGDPFTMTQAMTLDASGNLGVGVTSPASKLDIFPTFSGSTGTTLGDTAYADIYARSGGYLNQYGQICFGYTGNYATAAIGFLPTLASGNTKGDLVFATRDVTTDTAPTERFRIAANGAWGLAGANYGTSGQVLTSQGSGSPPIWAAGGGGGGSPAGSTGQFQYNNAGSFAAAPSMMSTNGTNVTFDPTSSNRLEFFRNVNNSTDSIRYYNETTGPYYYSLENYTSSPVRGLVWGNNYFNPAGWSQVMTFMNMNVAIGTKTPGAKFHVSDGSNLYFGDAGSVGWSGNPMVRNPANSGYLIMMNGTTGGVGLTGGGTSWSALSDERHKTNLVPIENGLSKVMTLRAVTGRYVVDNPNASRSFLIAQDVQKVLPEAVSIADDGRMLLGYTDTIPLLVAAIKELKAEFDAYKLSHP